MKDGIDQVNDVSRRARELGPWRYNHQHDGLVIRSENPAAGAFDTWGRPMVQQLLATVFRGRSLGDLRVLDLGCLEGHFSDVLCEMGFGEVVALDLSKRHLARARFLLEEVKGYDNVRVVEGNASDVEFMSELGRFDLVFFWGLLYHLKDPLRIFDVLENLIRDPKTFVLLLSTQYRGNFPLIVLPEPLGLVQAKPFESAEETQASTGFVFNPSDESAFESIATRLNPRAVYEALRLYGYQGVIAYDDPSGHSYSFNSNLVVTKTRQKGLVDLLNREVLVDGVGFYEWDGNSVNGYNFESRPKAVLYRSLYRLVRGHLGIRAKQKAGILIRGMANRARHRSRTPNGES